MITFDPVVRIFASVFSESERDMAARRLSDYGYHRA
jgi:hypothetical protein